VAAFLDRTSQVQDVAVGGWTPDSMDAPTMELTLRREDLALRFFDPQQSLLIPATDGSGPTLIARPTILPLDPALRAPLQRSGAVSETAGSFVYYSIEQVAEPAPQITSGVVFGDEILFLGYTPSPRCMESESPPDCFVITYWRILQQPAGARRLFLHVVDQQGTVLGTADALGAPSAFWRRGDMLLQKHQIASEHLLDYEAIRLGVYDPFSGQRLLTAGGQEFERLKPQLNIVE